MNRRILSAFLCLFGFMTCAMATEPSVSVENKYDQKTSWPRSNVAQINLKPASVEIVTKDGNTLRFTKESIARILLSDTANGLDNLQAEGGISIEKNVVSDFVLIKGLEGAGDAFLFDLSGMPVIQTVVSPENPEISTAQLPAGLYLLVIGDQTFKIIKK